MGTESSSRCESSEVSIVRSGLSLTRSSCTTAGIHSQNPETRPPLRSRPYCPDDLRTPIRTASVVRDSSRRCTNLQLASPERPGGSGHLSTRDPGREAVKYGRDRSWAVGVGEEFHRGRVGTGLAAEGELLRVLPQFIPEV